jgi:hypothetical protein
VVLPLLAANWVARKKTTTTTTKKKKKTKKKKTTLFFLPTVEGRLPLDVCSSSPE